MQADFVARAESGKSGGAHDNCRAAEQDMDKRLAAERLHEIDFCGHIALLGGSGNGNVFGAQSDDAGGNSPGGKDVHRRSADKTGHEKICGVFVEVKRLGDLLNASFVHNHDTLPHGHRFRLIMGYVNHGCAKTVVEPDYFSAHFDSHFRIEI